MRGAAKEERRHRLVRALELPRPPARHHPAVRWLVEAPGAQDRCRQATRLDRVAADRVLMPKTLWPNVEVRAAAAAQNVVDLGLIR